MAGRYPKREQFFAHRFTRLLTKAAVAQDLGHLTCWLLTIIVHQEDSVRYSRGVTFWNDKLRDLMGVRKWDTINSARQKAMDEGWLHYESRGNRRPGVYWVLIPEWAEAFDDTPVDDGTYPPNGDNAGIIAGTIMGQSGVRQGDNGGDPSIPIPIPIPISCPEASGDAAGPEVEGEQESPKIPDEPPEEPVMRMPCIVTTKTPNPDEWLVMPSKVAEWQETFSGVDVMAELVRARQWLRDNPSRKKTQAGMSRFLGTWLSKRQDEYRPPGRERPAGPSVKPSAGPKPLTDDQVAEINKIGITAWRAKYEQD